MTYLAASFAAPALGVYPYMLMANTPSLLPHSLLFVVLLFVNMGIAAMIVLMAYSVVFFEALLPERVIKHNLIHLLLRGSLVAVAVIGVIQVLPERERLLGLPRDLILATSIVTIIVVGQLLINLAKPAIDSVIFYRDRHEIAWITELDRRLLTTSDLQQALENILTTLCEVLRVRTGFIYNLVTSQGPRLEARVGPIDEVEKALSHLNAANLVEQKNGHDDYHFITQDGFWFILLRNQARDQFLGLLGIQARAGDYDLTLEEEETAQLLIQEAERALEDRRLQQGIFTALKGLFPEIERVQLLQHAVSYAGAPNLTTLDQKSLIHEKDFPQMVRDALSHYWGGPKLTSSPLLGLRVVQEALHENDGNSVRALRAVLGQAIEKQRPEGERRKTTAEWLIYNILDMKFVQGMRVREIAQRLAMSEADLYRKQRLAIEEVARTLSEMEAQGDEEPPSLAPPHL
jgi:hypothetical protein